MRLKKTTSIFKNRRGISAVISNLILIGAVIAVGFAVLAWSQWQSSNYNSLYGLAIKSDTDQLRERIAFEFFHYDTTTNVLKVYLMNSGTIDGVSIANVYINNTSYVSQSFSALRLLSSNTEVSSLNMGQEGYFLVYPSSTLELGKNYPIILVTGRGSSFVATFAT